MQLKELKPRKALNKAFLKIKPNRTEIEHFKANLIQLLDRTNDTESEEFHKNLVSDFLKKTYYDPNYYESNYIFSKKSTSIIMPFLMRFLYCSHVNTNFKIVRNLRNLNFWATNVIKQ